jgi:hypothetical protein
MAIFFPALLLLVAAAAGSVAAAAARKSGDDEKTMTTTTCFAGPVAGLSVGAAVTYDATVYLQDDGQDDGAAKVRCAPAMARARAF